MTDVVEVMARGMFRAEAWSSFWSEYDAKKLVRASLTALESAGWCVVPVDPTEEMSRAGWKAPGKHFAMRYPDDMTKQPNAVWSAMLSSAPRPGE